MNKAFTREAEPAEEDDDPQAAPLPAGVKNYITHQGYARLRAELLSLLDEERPKIVEVVSWAAKNGDRSENGDYLYGKKRLREIDRRIRFLTRRLDIAERVDPSVHHGSDQIFLGATVTYVNAAGDEKTITIVATGKVLPNTLEGQIQLPRECSYWGLRSGHGSNKFVAVPQWLEFFKKHLE
jgi:transcription elongation factor GreB